jgi:hypothetical protein
VNKNHRKNFHRIRESLKTETGLSMDKILQEEKEKLGKLGAEHFQ